MPLACCSTRGVKLSKFKDLPVLVLKLKTPTLVITEERDGEKGENRVDSDLRGMIRGLWFGSFCSSLPCSSLLLARARAHNENNGQI